MFDLSKLDIVTPSEAGKPCTIFYPGTTTPVRDDKGEPVVLRLLGRHSNTWRDLSRQMNDEAAAAVASGKAFSDADQKAWDRRRLAAVTRAWTITHLDGEEISCTAEVAEKIYADPRFAVVYAQAWFFATQDGNFLGA